MTWLTGTRVWLVVSAAVALALPPLLLRAEPAGFDAHALQVSSMTQTERDRLDHLTREYLALSEEQRAHYRNLHAQIEEDVATGQGQLKQTMEDYYAWRSTLPRLQQEELRKTTDSAGRIELIKEYVEGAPHDELREITNPWVRNMFAWGKTPVLTPAQLKELMTAIEDNVTLTSEQQERLDPPGQEPLTGIERYLELIDILKDRNWRLDEFLDRVSRHPVLDALPTPDLTAAQGDADPQQRRRMFLAWVLFANLHKELDAERSRHRPTEEQLRNMVANWPQDEEKQLELAELLELEPDEFHRKLEREYIAQEFMLDPGPLWQVLPEGMRRPPNEGPRRRDEAPARQERSFQFRPGERNDDGDRGDGQRGDGERRGEFRGDDERGPRGGRDGDPAR